MAQLGKHPVGVGHPPLVIAEMSGNHNGSLDRALQIVEEVARAGAHGIKLQTYTPDTMTLDLAEREFLIEDESSEWYGESLYNLYERGQTPWEWHEKIFSKAREFGLLAFSTAYDETALRFLESLDVPVHKVASFEITHLPLIEATAATGKPLLISTGMATLGEIDEAVRAARGAGCRDLILLKCTSAYPAPAEEANLVTIPHLRTVFDCEIGLSDHTLDIGVPLVAVAMGAALIEKHVTLSRSDGGVDAAFSLEPSELSALVNGIRRGWEALGSMEFGPTESEVGALSYRRSLYVTRDMEAHEVLTGENLKAIRPGLGLPAKHLGDLLGRRVGRSVEKGTPATWDMIAPERENHRNGDDE